MMSQRFLEVHLSRARREVNSTDNVMFLLFYYQILLY